MDQTAGQKGSVGSHYSWAKAKYSLDKNSTTELLSNLCLCFCGESAELGTADCGVSKVVLDELVLENKIISFWKVPHAYIGMCMSGWVFPCSEHPTASSEIGESNFLGTHFLKAFSKNLFHTHLHCLQLAKCENLTCKWQWSWATAEVVPLIHWHFWDSETKNVWTFRRRAFVLYTNSSPCCAYTIVIVYSDSQPSSLECQVDTGDGEAHKHCPFPCS